MPSDSISPRPLDQQSSLGSPIRFEDSVIDSSDSSLGHNLGPSSKENVNHFCSLSSVIYTPLENVSGFAHNM